ncbi:MAG: hypothetical protein VB138_12915 [Burkholderia sp.]
MRNNRKDRRRARANALQYAGEAAKAAPSLALAKTNVGSEGLLAALDNVGRHAAKMRATA